MDQRRFDALTRSLASSKTRRGFLGGLAALVVAAQAASSESACPPGQTHTRRGECRCHGGADACPDGCFNLKRDPSNCGACGSVCPPGARCSNGNCRCRGGQTLDPVAGCVDPATSTSTAVPTSTNTAVPTSTNTAVPTSTNTAVPTATPSCDSGLAEGAQCGAGRVCLDSTCIGAVSCTATCSPTVIDNLGRTCRCSTTIEGGLFLSAGASTDAQTCSSSTQCLPGQLCRTGCDVAGQPTGVYRCAPVCPFVA